LWINLLRSRFTTWFIIGHFLAELNTDPRATAPDPDIMLKMCCRCENKLQTQRALLGLSKDPSCSTLLRIELPSQKPSRCCPLSEKWLPPLHLATFGAFLIPSFVVRWIFDQLMMQIHDKRSWGMIKWSRYTL
jgi:hypothetical protein